MICNMYLYLKYFGNFLKWFHWTSTTVYTTVIKKCQTCISFMLKMIIMKFVILSIFFLVSVTEIILGSRPLQFCLNHNIVLYCFYGINLFKIPTFGSWQLFLSWVEYMRKTNFASSLKVRFTMDNQRHGLETQDKQLNVAHTTSVIWPNTLYF